MSSPAFDNGPAVLFGAFDPSDWQGSLNAITAGTYDAIDKLTGQPMSMTAPQLSWAYGYNADGSPKYQRLYTPRLDADRKAGRVSMLTVISFNLANKNDLAFNNEAILAGKHDGWINQFAQDAAAYGHPFIVRLNPEMNGWWEGPFSEFDSSGNLTGGNTYGSYVRAWRYVVGKVKAVAPNVKWYWCINPVAPKTAPSTTAPLGGSPTSANMVSHFYPGDDLVDYTGCDLYNYGASQGYPWLSFRQCMEGDGNNYGNTLAAILSVAPGKPMIIGELGCADAPGDKATWVLDALQTIPQRYPMIKMVSWFNWGSPFAITAGPVGQAFGQGLSDPHWLKAGTFPLDGTPYVLAGSPTADAQLASVQAQLAQANALAATSAAQLTTAQAQLANAQQASATLSSQLATAQADRDAARADAATGRTKVTDLQSWAKTSAA